jgi:CRP-like cAMP-binding protein
MSKFAKDGLQLFLDHIRMHTNLAPKEEEALLSLCAEEVTYAAHQDVVRPRQKVNHACLVVEGLAARFDRMRDGRRTSTGLYIPGDMCDLASVVAPVAAWGVEAFTTTKLLLVPHAELRALVGKYPTLALAFWRDTTLESSRLAKWVANVGRKDAPARLAHLFCELGLRMEQADFGKRTEYTLPATQAQLGDLMGLTETHVNRSLGALRMDEVVTFDRGLVIIDDWDRIVARAQFDPIYLFSIREDAHDRDVGKLSLRIV